MGFGLCRQLSGHGHAKEERRAGRGWAVSEEVDTRWFCEGAPPDNGVDVSR